MRTSQAGVPAPSPKGCREGPCQSRLQRALKRCPEFLGDAKRNMLDVEPEDGKYLTALIQKVYATPKPIVDKIGELIK